MYNNKRHIDVGKILHTSSISKETLQFPDGKYYGQVINGKRDGAGAMFFNNGNTYQGAWENGDKIDAKEGLMVYANGDRINTYFDNKYDPVYSKQAMVIYANGDFYAGYLTNNNKPSGYGEMWYANGDYYEGEWNNGNPVNPEKIIKDANETEYPRLELQLPPHLMTPVAMPLTPVKTPSPVRVASPAKTVKKICKKGTRMNKKTGNCESKKSASSASKRCKNGTRKNKKTGNCEKYVKK